MQLSLLQRNNGPEDIRTFGRTVIRRRESLTFMSDPATILLCDKNGVSWREIKAEYTGTQNSFNTKRAVEYLDFRLLTYYYLICSESLDIFTDKGS